MSYIKNRNLANSAIHWVTMAMDAGVEKDEALLVIARIWDQVVQIPDREEFIKHLLLQAMMEVSDMLKDENADRSL